MLFLLRYPSHLLGVVIALAVGIPVHCLAQAGAAVALGDRMPRATKRLTPDPRAHFEPFGVIAMLLSGVGWNKPVSMQEPRGKFRRGRYTLAVLAGPFANVVLAVIGLLLLKVAGSDVYGITFPGASFFEFPFAQALAFEFAVVNGAVAALTLLPIPPLDGARLLWAYTPPTHLWQQARYHLEERNIGIGICLVLMLPIFKETGLLFRLCVSIADAFLAPLAHAFGLAAF